MRNSIWSALLALAVLFALVWLKLWLAGTAPEAPTAPEQVPDAPAGANEKRSPSAAGSLPCGTATYHARPGSVAKLMPTSSAVRASGLVVSVSNAEKSRARS